nr:hypothetical protein [Tanacetum cinerariifolium]
MSRDMLTVGSTMRIPLLYRGEYSQWVERFMNYIEEKTDGEAMINSIKNGDQPLPRVTQVSIAGTTSTEQPPLKDKSMWSDQEKRRESLSTHDALIDSSQKFDNLDEFSEPLISIHIAEEERIRREHADYISRMEMLFTINPRPHPTVNADIIFESLSLLPIPVQDSNSQREEIDIVTETDDVLPPGVENKDDSDGEIDAVDDLCVNNSISTSEHEYSDDEESNFDNPLVPLSPPEPPDEEFKFELDSEDEILVVRNTILEFEYLNPRVEFDVSNDENDDYSYFMFVMFYKVFSFLFAESEDTIFDLGIFI